MKGWVRIDREVLKMPFFKDAELVKIYLWCKLKASHSSNSFRIKVGNGCRIIEVEPGQFITGRDTQEAELLMSFSTIRRKLIKLKDYGLISLNPTHQYTLITICKTDDSVELNDQVESPMNHRYITNASPTKPINNDNNENKEKEDQFLAFWDFYHSETKLPKTDLAKAERAWRSLTATERQIAIARITEYVAANKPGYFKKACNYLLDKSFSDDFTKDQIAHPELNRKKLTF